MNPIRALSWNVNGIRAIYRKGFSEWFAQESPDILCLQETKSAPDQVPPPLQGVAGYYAYFAAAERKGYSGVALYTKSRPEQVSYGFGHHAVDKEGRIIVADYPDFALLNIYFPNGRSSLERLRYKMDFYDTFLDFVNGLRKQRKNVVVCGDFNTAHKEIDLARPKANAMTSGFLPEERAWLDKFIAHGYVDTFRAFNSDPGQYTYWDQITSARERNVGWRIDYFFVNQECLNRIANAYILPQVMGSDHCPVGIDIKPLPD